MNDRFALIMWKCRNSVLVTLFGKSPLTHTGQPEVVKMSSGSENLLLSILNRTNLLGYPRSNSNRCLLTFIAFLLQRTFHFLVPVLCGDVIMFFRLVKMLMQTVVILLVTSTFSSAQTDIGYETAIQKFLFWSLNQNTNFILFTIEMIKLSAWHKKQIEIKNPALDDLENFIE